MSSNASVLVVANRTADSPELIATLSQRAARSPAHFTLLVPAVPRGLAWATDMKAGGREALPRAELGAGRMRIAGLDLRRTIVGDPDPLAAIGDALRGGKFDEVIISTLPRGISRWLRLSLPHRVRRITDIPVLHVTAHPRSAQQSPRSREPAGAAA